VLTAEDVVVARDCGFVFDPTWRLGQFGETLGVIRPNGRMTTHSMAGELRPTIASLARFIEYSQHIELSDRMWDEQP
jgi:hypothetical protein